MKFMVIPCLILAGTLASSSVAKEPHTGIEVTAPATLAAWTNMVGGNLDRNLDHEMRQSMVAGAIPTGMASVRFRCSDSGQPTAVELTRKSSNRRLNNIAREVVAGIKTLHPLPLGVTADQVFVANVVVASDQKQYDRNMAILRDEARRTNAAGMTPQAIAFNVSANSPG